MAFRPASLIGGSPCKAWGWSQQVAKCLLSIPNPLTPPWRLPQYIYRYIYDAFPAGVGDSAAPDCGRCWCWSSCVPPLLFFLPPLILGHLQWTCATCQGQVLLTVIFCILRTPLIHIVFRRSSNCLPLLVLWPYNDCLCFFNMKTSMLSGNTQQ